MSHGSGAEIGVDETRTLLAHNAATRLIDVRTPGEFAGSRITGSCNVPLELLREHRRGLRAAHGDPVVLVCRSGTRAEEARRLVAESGLADVHVLRGGIAAWESADAPLVRGRGAWAMERQVRLAAGTIVLLAVVASLLAEPVKWLAAAVGAGLVVAAVTDTCAMARALSLLPWNRAAAGGDPAALSALTAPAGERG
ncbi:rhodanese-like domain-containing protein [Streptomonospora sp. PA3]|uniref:rhodanese-like domain-containing protein n=1 Tax=Streptomonospora sp. PA3 TaxID=2607326 RepID=UPI0012DC03CE|nr:rhodanese-like domain-containing protein [Streptomonospora sp. PA3]MUL41529.1 rhodanese-like domain-containing protein [Streptomonospora sp. PA3]